MDIRLWFSEQNMYLCIRQNKLARTIAKLIHVFKIINLTGLKSTSRKTYMFDYFILHYFVMEKLLKLCCFIYLNLFLVACQLA